MKYTLYWSDRNLNSLYIVSNSLAITLNGAKYAHTSNVITDHMITVLTHVRFARRTLRQRVTA